MGILKSDSPYKYGLFPAEGRFALTTDRTITIQTDLPLPNPITTKTNSECKKLVLRSFGRRTGLFPPPR